MSKPYTSRVTQITIAPEGEPIFSEAAIVVTIDDEAGGEFIKIEDCGDHESSGVIGFDPDAWRAIRSAVESLLDVIAMRESGGAHKDRCERCWFHYPGRLDGRGLCHSCAAIESTNTIINPTTESE